MLPIRLFISYRSLDSTKVDALVARLRSLNNADGSPTYDVWQDKFGIPPGKDWWEAIVDAIIACDVFVFMVSRESVKNVNCRAELNYGRRRNRPIVPLVLEDEFNFNQVTGKNDIDYWPNVPNDLTDGRLQFLFYEGTSFVKKLSTAIEHITHESERWNDIPVARPPDPRLAADSNSDSIALYGQAYDFALRGELDAADHIFRRLMNATASGFNDESREWVLILVEYAELVRLDAHEGARYKLQAAWPNYSKRFPLPFLRFFDPKGIQARINGSVDPTPLKSVSNAAPPPKSDAPQRYAEATRLIEAGEDEDALLILEALQREQYKPRYGTLADVIDRAQQGIAERAAEAERQRLTAEAADAYTDLASYIRTAPPQKALSELERFISEYPGHGDPDNLRGRIKLSLPPPPKVESPKTAQPPMSPDQQRLLVIMLDIKRPPAERAKAGQDINQFGDPRPGVIDLSFGADYWCKVPAGKFTYQSDAQASIDYDYWMGKYPITYAQYKAFLDDPNGYRSPQWWKGLNAQGLDQQKAGAGTQNWKIANHPAENVSWYDAMAFCAWLNAKLTLDQALRSQGYSFRLPTEREWEKSARGTDGREYPYVGEFDAAKGNVSETGIGQTSAVGIFPDGASPYGILDLSGNVWDWTLTEYRSLNSNNLSNIERRVVRGGSWNYSSDFARAAYRDLRNPGRRLNGRGFRVCCGAVPIT